MLNHHSVVGVVYSSQVWVSFPKFLITLVLVLSLFKWKYSREVHLTQFLSMLSIEELSNFPWID